MTEAIPDAQNNHPPNVPDHPAWLRRACVPGTVLLTIPMLRELIPASRGAKRLASSTLTRWIDPGLPGRDGNRVRLRAIRAGSRWLVDPADLVKFFDALAADPSDTQ